MTDRTSREMLIACLTECGFVVDEALKRRFGLEEEAGREPMSVAEAIAADLALDDAIAAAIEREAGKA